MQKNILHLVPKIFILASLYNIFGILLFSAFFTNPLLSESDPIVFSWLGQVSILLWGFAYWSIYKSYKSNLFLVSVFFVEKMIYATTWFNWLLNNEKTLISLSLKSEFTAFFFKFYGLGDFIFGIFFLWVVIKFFGKQ